MALTLYHLVSPGTTLYHLVLPRITWFRLASPCISDSLVPQDNEANLKIVAEQLRTSIRQLCDKLKDNPNVAENMAKIASERQQLQVRGVGCPLPMMSRSPRPLNPMHETWHAASLTLQLKMYTGGMTGRRVRKDRACLPVYCHVLTDDYCSEALPLVTG